MVLVHARVDQVAQRPLAEAVAQRLGDAIAPGRRARVHEQDAVVADLGDDVHVAEVEHVDVALHRQHAHLARGSGLGDGAYHAFGRTRGHLVLGVEHRTGDREDDECRQSGGAEAPPYESEKVRSHHFAAGVAGISAISLRSFGRYSGYDASL
jgi:hypothetical protein